MSKTLLVILPPPKSLYLLLSSPLLMATPSFLISIRKEILLAVHAKCVPEWTLHLHCEHPGFSQCLLLPGLLWQSPNCCPCFYSSALQSFLKSTARVDLLRHSSVSPFHSLWKLMAFYTGPKWYLSSLLYLYDLNAYYCHSTSTTLASLLFLKLAWQDPQPYGFCCSLYLEYSSPMHILG